MQTVAFAEALSKICAETRLDNLSKLLGSMISGFGTGMEQRNYAGNFSALAFAAVSQIKSLANEPSVNPIIQALELESILQPELLGVAIGAVNGTPNIGELRKRNDVISIMCRIKESLDAVLRFRTAVDTLLILPSKQSIEQVEASLEFEIVDLHNRGIGFDRFRAILASIQALHDTVARALEVEGRLAIAYLDSGSNSIISIKSNEKIVAGMRKLIGDIWDRIRFNGIQKFERKLEAAEEAIEFVEMIEQKQKEGKIDAAFASQLKHVAVKDTLNLFGKGATLREINTEAKVDNQRLLIDRIDVKLLEQGSTEGHQASGSETE